MIPKVSPVVPGLHQSHVDELGNLAGNSRDLACKNRDLNDLNRGKKWIHQKKWGY